MRQRAYGPDKLHGARMAELPVVAQRWRQLHERLSRLRGSLRKHPKNHPHWSGWYSEAEQLLQLRQQLLQPMRAAGFRVYRDAGGTPLASFRELQKEQLLEDTKREHHRANGEIEGWEAFSAGWDPDSLPRVKVKQHTPAASRGPWPP